MQHLSGCTYVYQCAPDKRLDTMVKAMLAAAAKRTEKVELKWNKVTLTIVSETQRACGQEGDS